MMENRSEATETVEKIQDEAHHPWSLGREIISLQLSRESKTRGIVDSSNSWLTGYNSYKQNKSCR